ncbi:early endosome antigen 1-like [Mercenaria mercenaria]|uniref:early endosome antigen 1-like n=1 Tax=Mercenaria mercenaria TaxID=6596 RepID=UPI00234E98ED|nr:early endosome antigen 1-like [Mercenaria mercenaria]
MIQLKQLKNALSGTKDKSQLKFLNFEIEILENRILRLKKRRNSDNSNEEKDRKTLKERLSTLRRKLKTINKKLSRATDKSVKKNLLEKKEKVEKRIRRLTGSKIRPLKKRTNVDEGDEDKDGKIVKERLSNLRRRLRTINKELSRATSKSAKKVLLEKKDKVEKRIRRLTGSKSNDGNKEKKRTDRENDNDNDTNRKQTETDAEKLKRLVKKLRRKQKLLSEIKDVEGKKSLNYQIEMLETRIRLLKKRTNVDEDNEDKDGKTVKERLSNLRRRLRTINKKLSRATNKSAKNVLLEKKDKVEKRIQRLTSSKSNDGNKEKKSTDRGNDNDETNRKQTETDAENLKRLVKKLRRKQKLRSEIKDVEGKKSLNSQIEMLETRIRLLKKRTNVDEINEDKDGKTEKERLSNLRRRLRTINRKLSRATNKSAKNVLLEKKDKVEKRIRRLTSSKDNDGNKEEKSKDNDYNEISNQANKKQTETDAEKLKRLVKELRRKQKLRSEIKDVEKKKSLRYRIEMLETKIRLLRRRINLDKDSKVKNRKTVKERLSDLRRRLKTIYNKLSRTTDKSVKKVLLEKKKNLEKRIERLTGSKDGENRSRVRDNEMDAKSAKERLAILQNKSDKINKRLSDTKYKPVRRTLLKKKEIVENRIIRLTSEKEGNTKKDEKPNKKKQNNKPYKSSKTDKSKNREQDQTDEERLKQLIKEIKTLRQILSATNDKRERDTLQKQIDKTDSKIRRLKRRINGEDNADKMEAKYVKERLAILQNKLDKINKRLSDTNEKPVRRTLLKRKEIVENRIRRLTSKKEDNTKKDEKPKKKKQNNKPYKSSKTDKSKNREQDQTDEEKLKQLIKELKTLRQVLSATNDKRERDTLQKQIDNKDSKIRRLKRRINGDDNADEMEAKSVKERLAILQNKLDRINERLSDTKGKPERRTLLEKKEIVENRIRQLTSGKENDTKKDEKPKKKKQNNKPYKSSKTDKSKNREKDQTDEEKIKQLIKELKTLRQVLSATNDKRERDTLQKQIDDKDSKIRRLKRRINSDDNADEMVAKSVKERLAILQNKLDRINERLSDTKGKPERRTLLEKKEIVENRIRQLTSGKENNTKKDEKPNKKKQNNKPYKSSKTDKSKNREQDQTDEEKLKQLINELKKLRQLLSATNDKRERDTLQKQIDDTDSKIRRLKRRINGDDDADKMEAKSVKERLAILQNKLDRINERLSDTKGKPERRTLLEKKEIVENRIRQLTSGKENNTKKDEKPKKKKQNNKPYKSSKTDKSKNREQDQTDEEKLKQLIKEFKKLRQLLSATNDKRERDTLQKQINDKDSKIRRLKRRINGDDDADEMEAKSVKERLAILQNKLDRINERLSDTKGKPERRTLLEKKEIVENRIRQLTSGKENNTKKDEKPNKKKQNNKPYKSSKTDKSKNREQDQTVEEKLKQLIKELKKLRKVLSATNDKRERDTLQKQIDDTDSKIRRLKKRINGDDDADEMEAKSVKERLAILQNKLDKINGKLSDTKEKPVRRTLLEKKEIVENRIRQLTSGKENNTKKDEKPNKKKQNNKPYKSSKTDKSKNRQQDQTDEEKLKQLIKELKKLRQVLSATNDKRERDTLQKQIDDTDSKIRRLKRRINGDDDADEMEAKSVKERLAILQNKLDKINERLSDTKGKPERRTLLEKKEIVENRIRQLTSGKENNTKKDEKPKKKKQNNNPYKSSKTDKSKNREQDQTDEEKLKQLIKELKKLRQVLSATNDKRERDTLQKQIDDTASKIRRLKKRINGDDDADEMEAKSVKERLAILQNKLDKINGKLSDTKEKPVRRTLLKKKEIVEKRIRQLTSERKDNEKKDERSGNNNNDMKPDKSNKQDKTDTRSESDGKQSHLQKLKELNDKHRKITNRISNTEDKLNRQKKKKSILENKLKVKTKAIVAKDDSNKRLKNFGEMKISDRVEKLKSYLEKLELMLSQTINKEKRKYLKEDKEILKKRISGLSEELKQIQEDGESDFISFNARLATLRRKLDIVNNRMKKADVRKTLKALKKKKVTLEKRIKKLTDELRIPEKPIA